jgi:hypothetical protein
MEVHWFRKKSSEETDTSQEEEVPTDELVPEEPLTTAEGQNEDPDSK